LVAGGGPNSGAGFVVRLGGMVDREALEALEPSLRRLQLIVVALATGSLAWSIVVLFLRQARSGQWGQGTGLLSVLAGAWAALAVLSTGVVMRAIVAGGLRRIAAGRYDQGRSSAATGFAQLIETTGDNGRLFAILQTQRILGAALLEGAALFAGVTYLLEGRVALLAVAALLACSILLFLPTRSSLERWLTSCTERLEELRSEGGER